MSLRCHEVVLPGTALMSQDGHFGLPQFPQCGHVLPNPVIVQNPARARVDRGVDVKPDQGDLPSKAEVVHGEEVRMSSPRAQVQQKRMSFNSLYLISSRGQSGLP